MKGLPALNSLLSPHTLPQCTRLSSPLPTDSDSAVHRASPRFIARAYPPGRERRSASLPTEELQRRSSPRPLRPGCAFSFQVSSSPSVALPPSASPPRGLFRSLLVPPVSVSAPSARRVSGSARRAMSAGLSPRPKYHHFKYAQAVEARYPPPAFRFPPSAARRSLALALATALVLLGTSSARRSPSLLGNPQIPGLPGVISS